MTVLVLSRTRNLFPLRNHIPEMKGSDTLASKTWHIGVTMNAHCSCPGFLSPKSFGTRGRSPLAARLGWGSQDREETEGMGMSRCLLGKRQAG